MPVPMPVPQQQDITPVSNSAKENSSDCSSESGASSGRKTPPLDANAAPFYPRGHSVAEQPVQRQLFNATSDERVSFGQSLQPPEPPAAHLAHWPTERVPRAEAAPRSWPAWRGWEDRAWAEQRAWEAPKPDPRAWAEAPKPEPRAWTEAPKPERPALSAQQVERQRKMVMACLRARARGLSHMQPPANLEELHRQVLSGKHSGAAAHPAELTPRFSPQLGRAAPTPEETSAAGSPPESQADQAIDLARLTVPAAETRAEQLFVPPAVHADALAPEKCGLDLTFLDEEESPGGKTIPEMSPMSALFLGLPPPSRMPTAAQPPVPRFLQR